MGSVSAPESSIAAQGRAMFAMHVWSTMKELDDLDYDTWTQWKLEVEVILGMMDLDLALREDKPSTPTETSLPEEKSKYEKWEKSNSLSLLLMRSKMSNHVRSFLPGSENVKQYFAGIENLVAKFEEDGAFLLFDKLFKMKYDGEGNVREHIFRMCSLANRLRNMGRKFGDEFLLPLVIESLPSQFDVLKATAQTEDWKLDDLISKSACYETSIREVGMAGPVLGKRGRIRNTSDNGSDKNNVDNFDGQQRKRVQIKRVIRCFSCGREGHHQKDCTN